MYAAFVQRFVATIQTAKNHTPYVSAVRPADSRALGVATEATQSSAKAAAHSKGEACTEPTAASTSVDNKKGAARPLFLMTECITLCKASMRRHRADQLQRLAGMVQVVAVPVLPLAVMVYLQVPAGTTPTLVKVAAATAV